LKISIASTYEEAGGAGVAANRLSKALTEFKDASVCKCFRYSRDKQSKQVDHFLPKDANANECEILAKYQRYLIATHRTSVTNTLFTGESTAWDISNFSEIKECDVINIHWVSEFLNSKAIHSLFELGKPIVWTLHDERAFTGGCHYSYGCEGFKRNCSACPQLQPNLHWLAENNFENRMKFIGQMPIHFVSPSNWLKDKLISSSVFNKDLHEVSVIRNSVDLDIFKPASRQRKTSIREKVGIPEKNICILIGCFSWEEERKGFKFLHDALRQFSQALKGNSFDRNITLVSMGDGDFEIDGIEHKSLGFLSEETEISETISCCDLFLNMSREDNLPNTIVESLACGVPVISTNVGGIPEMYDPDKSGRLITRDDAKSMSEALLMLASNPELIKQFSANARLDAEKNYSPKTQASEYFELFGEMIRCQKGNPAKSRSTLAKTVRPNNSQEGFPIRIPAIEYFPESSYSDNAFQWFENKIRSES
jgi:glycosyltransferase involved in cell wall biosynthesis